jgi:hypothetical protein
MVAKIMDLVAQGGQPKYKILSPEGCSQGKVKPDQEVVGRYRLSHTGQKRDGSFSYKFFIELVYS